MTVWKGARRGDEGQVDEEADNRGGGREQRGEQDGGAGPAEGRAEAERDGGGAGQCIRISAWLRELVP